MEALRRLYEDKTFIPSLTLDQIGEVLRMSLAFVMDNQPSYRFTRSDSSRWTIASASGPAPMIRADARLRCHGRPTK